MTNPRNEAASFSNFYQDTWTLDLDGGTTFMELIRLPAGTFVMGSPLDELSRSANEIQHEVTISQDFYLGLTEVTQAQWLAISGSFPAAQDYAHAEMPVHNVSWEDLQPWLTALDSAITEPASFALPTESQWEYACRAGTTSRFHFGGGFGADEFCSSEAERMTNMWYCGNNSPNGPKAVGQKAASAWGLHDMHGNVLEWCADRYAAYPEGPVTDPSGPVAGNANPLVRGGCWNMNASLCRSAKRGTAGSSNRMSVIGFRVVAVR